jgi:acyl carrier protein
MQQQEVLSKLQEIFDTVFLDEVVVTPELSAKDVPEWDSITHVTLIMAVEEGFGIRFRVGEVEATQNVGDLANLIIKCIDRG